jgi:hypothetical protein
VCCIRLMRAATLYNFAVIIMCVVSSSVQYCTSTHIRGCVLRVDLQVPLGAEGQERSNHRGAHGLHLLQVRERIDVVCRYVWRPRSVSISGFA